MSHNNPSGEKGTAAEVLVVKFLRDEAGLPYVERRRLEGRNDRGDVAGIPGLVIEVKNHNRMELAAWVDEAMGERVRVAGKGELGVVWHKRKGKASPGDWYVTMDGWTFLKFVKEMTR